MEREFQIHRTEEDYALAEFWRWALAFLIGVAMGCIGFAVDWGIEALNNFKFYHTVNTIATRGARARRGPGPAALHHHEGLGTPPPHTHTLILGRVPGTCHAVRAAAPAG